MRRLLHGLRVWRSKRRERKKDKERSSRWRLVRVKFLESHCRCAACGEMQELQVHHVRPFSLFPEKELDPNNLITLCMGERECHLRIGHGGSWKAYNEHVVTDAAEVRGKPKVYVRMIERAVRDTRFRIP